MTEQEVLRRIDALGEAIRDGRRHLEFIGMTREERASIEQQLDRIYARLDRARKGLAELRAPAS